MKDDPVIKILNTEILRLLKETDTLESHLNRTMNGIIAGHLQKMVADYQKKGFKNVSTKTNVCLQRLGTE